MIADPWVPSSRIVPILLAGLVLHGCNREKTPPADLVIRNAVLFTAKHSDGEVPRPGSVAVRGGRIVYVGPDSGLTRLIGRTTETIDATGDLLLPGFIDSHVHPYSGVELMECDLSNDSAPAQAVETIRRCAAERPNSAWFRGTGWQLTLFKDGNPSRALLD